VFVIIGLTATIAFAHCPFALLIAFAAAALVLGLARQGVHYGFLESKGWKFSAHACIKGMVPEVVIDLVKAIINFRDTLRRTKAYMENLPEEMRKQLEAIEASFEEFKNLWTKDLDEGDVEDADENWAFVSKPSQEELTKMLERLSQQQRQYQNDGSEAVG
jgi:hypothetical protein